MTTLTLVRQPSSPQGTFGRLYGVGYPQTLYTGELPWRDNKSNVSCVPTAQWCVDRGYCLPTGVYHVEMRRSPKMGWTYWLRDVPGRGFCLIHPANLMGDVGLGFRTQLQGCIALGLALGWMDGQKAVLRSRVAVVGFMDVMGREPFLLRITNAPFLEGG